MLQAVSRFVPNIINNDGSINIDQLFKVSSHRNLQVMTKYDHAVKTAAEWYTNLPVLTPSQRVELVDLMP